VGTEVPTPFQPGTNGGKTYTYQTVGMDISAQVRAGQEGRHYLTLSYTDTAAADAPRAEAPRSESFGATLQAIPVLRSWSMSNALLIRDGQTLPFGSVVDRLTGDVVKSEVTFTLIR
jgi:hypothetical protein